MAFVSSDVATALLQIVEEAPNVGRAYRGPSDSLPASGDCVVVIDQPQNTIPLIGGRLFSGTVEILLMFDRLQVKDIEIEDLCNEFVQDLLKRLDKNTTLDGTVDYLVVNSPSINIWDQFPELTGFGGVIVALGYYVSD